MIQRIQTLWLFLAMIFGALLFFFDVYHADVLTAGIPTTDQLSVAEHYPSFIVAVLVALLPFVTIFLFKDRKKQRSMVWVSMLATLSFLSINFMRINAYNQEHPDAKGFFFVSSFLPFVILFFLFMALKGIKKDDKLIKSLDRLR